MDTLLVNFDLNDISSFDIILPQNYTGSIPPSPYGDYIVETRESSSSSRLVGSLKLIYFIFNT